MDVDRASERMQYGINARLVHALVVLFQLHLEQIEPDVILRRADEIPESVQNKTTAPFRRKVIAQEHNTAGSRMRIKTVDRLAIESAVRAEVCNRQGKLEPWR